MEITMTALSLIRLLKSVWCDVQPRESSSSPGVRQTHPPVLGSTR